MYFAAREVALEQIGIAVHMLEIEEVSLMENSTEIAATWRKNNLIVPWNTWSTKAETMHLLLTKRHNNSLGSHGIACNNIIIHYHTFSALSSFSFRTTILIASKIFPGKHLKHTFCAQLTNGSSWPAAT